MSNPLCDILPFVGLNNPKIMFIKVVFPLPLEPLIRILSPLLMDKLKL